MDKKMEKIIAGLVQMDSGPDMNENMRMAEQYVREAAEQGAKLILFRRPQNTREQTCRATQVQCRATSAAGFPALPNGTMSICTAAA